MANGRKQSACSQGTAEPHSHEAEVGNHAVVDIPGSQAVDNHEEGIQGEADTRKLAVEDSSHHRHGLKVVAGHNDAACMHRNADHMNHPAVAVAGLLHKLPFRNTRQGVYRMGRGRHWEEAYRMGHNHHSEASRRGRARSRNDQWRGTDSVHTGLC